MDRSRSRNRDPEVLVAGETLIDFLPAASGPLSSVEGFDRRPGGAPANVAVALARLEEPPLFWTRVGDDPFGRYLRDALAEYGVVGRFVELDSDAKTSLAFVTHDEDGDREFSFYRDGMADTRLEPGRVDDATLAACEWVHAGGVALSSGRSHEATLDLLERASEAGCTVSFDPNRRPELWPGDETFRSVLGDALAHVDVLKATDDELEALGFEGESVTALAREARAAGPDAVFVTRGSDGAIAVTADGTASHPGYDPDIVDTTGAGDAFVAGTILGLREGRDLRKTLAFANAVGAAATTAVGAMAALPDRESVVSMGDGDVNANANGNPHDER
ncbi:carbohydrate kinase family protein [Halobiforma nitratireducens]|uniref:Fructokinase n=1 Tax=Halobiforma nitratireducens JCM 10879 TaxID=1227454 RepID=M0MNA6_9EURY|nr:carbohydrate kinase [Halobiforma nitratireducens]EMA46224.1 Fructokinase [Halobiforma nitratireducens JCM 10879]